MNKQEIINYVQNQFVKNRPAEFRIGDTVRVHAKIIEGTNVRVQVYEGIVISMKGQGATRTFTVRKISFGVGVERVFPLYSPTIEKITVVRSGKVRRAKLYYLRDRMGRASKLDEKETVTSDFKTGGPSSVAPVAVAAPAVELVSAKEK